MAEPYVLMLDGMAQSAVDLEDPTRLHFDYMRRIGDVLDRLPAGPLRILHVGGAAMTLPRYVATTRPRSAQIVLEPDQAVIDQVRIEAPLPRRSGIRVRVVDGLSGIVAVRDDSQDVVILDAFRDGLVPDELITADFFTQATRVLADDGLLIANVTDSAPFRRARDAIAAIRVSLPTQRALTVGAEPATLKAKRPGNLVVLAGLVPDRPFGAPAPSSYRVFEGAAASDSFGGGTARHLPD
ncbi:spermidine synthase [Nocardioides sp. Kera G14]|uniref:spermidine synthase n=1 Tax=Nocardioides sp. Kera G14 TaxID=2884264 RepID=UPI001D0F5605|nr:fused MFS/spermidine synthase [Nocardioides sp. Kera G14]UDY24935.1 fused MFS/spermidine synthase [Nocardioides sp. Kera G14]